MAVLAISHSVGDTNMSLALAEELSKGGIETTFLALGDAAKKRLETEKFATIENKFINKLALTQEELLNLAEKVKLSDYEAVVIGTPSYTDVDKQCDVPKQLLELWQGEIQTVLLNDYAFYDPKHHFFKEKWGQWANKIFMPFKKALDHLPESEKENAEVVGHPSIDAAREKRLKFLFSEAQSDVSSLSSEGTDNNEEEIPTKKAKTQEELTLYLAAGKAGDEALLEALQEADLAGMSMRVKIALHPAATPEYQEALKKIIGANTQIRFLSKEEKEEAFNYASAVLTVSSTVGTEAAAVGTPVAFYQPENTPYVVGDSDFPSAQVCKDSKGLLLFLKSVRDRQEKEEAPTLAPEGKQPTAGENMANAIRPMLRRPG